jgi:hypothetical protein
MCCSSDNWRCPVRENLHSNIAGSAAVPYILLVDVLCGAFSNVNAVGIYVIVSCPSDVKLTQCSLGTYVFGDDNYSDS